MTRTSAVAAGGAFVAMAAMVLGLLPGPAAASVTVPSSQAAQVAIGWWTPAGAYAPGVSLAQPSQSPRTHTTGRTVQLHKAMLPGALAIVSQGTTAARVARLGKLHGIRGVIAVDGGKVRIHGHLVNMIGANPATFRSWTPPQTASLKGIWSALAHDGFVTTPGTAKKLGLHTGKSYPISGARQPSASFGGQADLGLPDVDAVVGPKLSRELGLAHQIGVLISAPGVSTAKLKAMVRGVLGHQASLVSLTETQAVQQQMLVPNGQATPGRPDDYLTLFQDSAKLYCPGMSWTVLAAIGQIESGDGQNDGPSSAGALGPMQFMPGTWRLWGMDAFGQTGPPQIENPFDAVPSAAAYLCAAGAGNQKTLPKAIFSYNHAQWYVDEVLALAQEYGQEYH
jgi:Transglycosylase SLT domain